MIILIYTETKEWAPPQNIMTALRLMGCDRTQVPSGLVDALRPLRFHDTVPMCFMMDGNDFPLPTDEYPDTSFDFLGAWCGDNVFSITSAERPPDFRAAYTNRLKEDSERYHLKSNAVFGTSAHRHDAMVGTVSSKSLEESMAEEAAKNMARAVDASILQKIKEAADVGHIPKHKLKEMFKGIFGKDE